MIARQKYAHRCIRHTVPASSFHYLISGNHNRKDGYQCRHSQIESRTEIRLGDKPATDSRSQEEYFYKSFAGKSPNFAIARIAEISKKKKIQIHGGHTEQIGFTEFRKFTEHWHPWV